jgi:hypothetical protein
MSHRTLRHRTFLATASAALVTTSLAGCGADEPEDAATPDPGSSSESTDSNPEGSEEMTFEDISDDLGSMVGEDIQVRALVEEVVTPGVFTINQVDGNDLESVVVVGAESAGDLAPDQEVVVDATVESTLDPDSVAELLDVQLEDELLTDYEGQPYLEASSVAQADG